MMLKINLKSKALTFIDIIDLGPRNYNPAYSILRVHEISPDRINDQGFDSFVRQDRCNICNIIFDNIETLNAHNRMEHSEAIHSPACVS